MSDTIRVSRELLSRVCHTDNHTRKTARRELRNILLQAPSQPAADCGLEVVGYFFQHEETGQVMSVDAQQVEWGFEKNNPRLVNMGAIIRKSDADASDAMRLERIAELEDRNAALVEALEELSRCAPNDWVAITADNALATYKGQTK